MRKVAILTPSYDGKTVCDFCVSMAVIFQRAAVERPELQLNLNFWMHEALVQKARNNLFGDAYDAGFDDIVFIDADQSINADAFFRLLDHPVDAVGVPVVMKTDEERYNIRPENPNHHTWDKALTLLEVEVIGTGMLRLSRKAMASLVRQSKNYWDSGKKRAMICDLQIMEDGGIISEDVQICDKLRNDGIKIYADIKYTCDHFGVKRYKGNYARHLLNAVKKSMGQDE